jgi:hypothetical protein
MRRPVTTVSLFLIYIGLIAAPPLWGGCMSITLDTRRPRILLPLHPAHTLDSLPSHPLCRPCCTTACFRTSPCCTALPVLPPPAGPL